MPDDDTGTVATRPRPKSSERWSVKLSHPTERRRRVFASISENRARAFLMRRFPRGSEAYLESPTGETYHYEQERQGENGSDAELWAPFDPDTYKPPEEHEPPGQSEWADQEA